MSTFLDTLADIENRYDELEQLMAAPAVATDPTKLQDYGRERAELEEDGEGVAADRRDGEHAERRREERGDERERDPKRDADLPDEHVQQQRAERGREREGEQLPGEELVAGEPREARVETDLGRHVARPAEALAVVQRRVERPVGRVPRERRPRPRDLVDAVAVVEVDDGDECCGGEDRGRERRTPDPERRDDRSRLRRPQASERIRASGRPARA